MKRWIVLLVIVCLLLCACGKDQKTAESTGATTEETTEETSVETTVDTEPTEQTTVPTEPPVIYRHALTGEVLDAPWSGQVTAVMINNIRDAMPQCGISQADVFYEIEVESSITRCLALFSDFSDVNVIGPVRSARTAFSSVAVSFDAPLVHCGGSNYALNGQYGASSDVISNWEHIDEMGNGSYFFRDKDRQKKGYAFEHTLFTTGESLQKALENKGLHTPTEKTFGLAFQEQITLNGEKAEEITVTFKGGKTTTLVYDTATGLYKMMQFGKDHIDGNTGEAVAFKNVLAIYTDQWVSPNGVNLFFETLGSGEGYAAVNGQIVPILWSRSDLRSPYTYTLADGTPLTLDVGTTYVALVGAKHPIIYK